MASFIVLTQCDDDSGEGCTNYGPVLIMTSYLKLGFFVFIPVFSFIHLKLNFHLLEEKKFKTKFNTLYTNLYPLKKTVYRQMTFFCLKRFLIAFVTASMKAPISIAILVYTKLSLFTIGYTINQKPFENKMLNYIEITNECFIMVTGYYMGLFS